MAERRTVAATPHPWGCVCAELEAGLSPTKRRRSCRRIVAMRMRRAGDSVAEIASRLGCSTATVKTLLNDGGYRG